MDQHQNANVRQRLPTARPWPTAHPWSAHTILPIPGPPTVQPKLPILKSCYHQAKNLVHCPISFQVQCLSTFCPHLDVVSWQDYSWTISGQTLYLDKFWTNVRFLCLFMSTICPLFVHHLSTICPLFVHYLSTFKNCMLER